MKHEYIGEQSITIHGIGEAGARMSEEQINLPPLPRPGMRPENQFSRQFATYTHNELQAYARQAVREERERAAKVAEALEGIAGPTVHDIARAIRRGSV